MDVVHDKAILALESKNTSIRHFPSVNSDSRLLSASLKPIKQTKGTSVIDMTINTK